MVFSGQTGHRKTTTMRILTCFTPATFGTVRISGIDVGEDSMAVRRSIGYLPENVPLYDWMRVRSYLEFVTRLRELLRRIEPRIDRVSGVGDPGCSDEIGPMVV